MKKKAIAFCLASSLLLFGTTGLTAGLQNYSQTTHIPHQITTPDKVATPIGTLEFFDGVPIGKTTTPELGWKGVTDNPVDGVTNKF